MQKMLEKKLQEAIDNMILTQGDDCTGYYHKVYLTIDDVKIPIAARSIFVDAIEDNNLLIHINAIIS